MMIHTYGESLVMEARQEFAKGKMILI